MDSFGLPVSTPKNFLLRRVSFSFSEESHFPQNILLYKTFIRGKLTLRSPCQHTQKLSSIFMYYFLLFTFCFLLSLSFSEESYFPISISYYKTILLGKRTRRAHYSDQLIKLVTSISSQPINLEAI